MNQCYECKWIGSVPRSAHNSCHHPETKKSHDDGLGELLAIFASVGRGGPQIGLEAAKALNISAKSHGILSGWFNWPFNFDPVWLSNCDGFEAKNEAK